MTIAGLWWLAAVVGFLVYAFLPDPTVPPDCSGWNCMGRRGVLFMVGVAYGLPLLVAGLLIDAALIHFARTRVGSAALLGTLAAWVTIVPGAVFFTVL